MPQCVYRVRLCYYPQTFQASFIGTRHHSLISHSTGVLLKLSLRLKRKQALDMHLKDTAPRGSERERREGERTCEKESDKIE